MNDQTPQNVKAATVTLLSHVISNGASAFEQIGGLSDGRSCLVMGVIGIPEEIAVMVNAMQAGIDKAGLSGPRGTEHFTVHTSGDN